MCLTYRYGVNWSLFCTRTTRTTREFSAWWLTSSAFEIPWHFRNWPDADLGGAAGRQLGYTGYDANSSGRQPLTRRSCPTPRSCRGIAYR